MAANWDMTRLQGRLRLASGLILFAFVTMHMLAHVVLLISFEWADAALALMMAPWRTIPGTVLLAVAFLAHYTNAIWAIYARRSLRMPQWELWQILLGLAIPFLLALHVMGTRVAELAADVHSSYASTILLFWYS